MKSYRCVLFVVCASAALPLLATTQAEEAAPRAVESKELIPLAAGNRWDYRRFHYAEDGKPVGETEEQTAVRRASDFSDGRCFLVADCHELSAGRRMDDFAQSPGSRHPNRCHRPRARNSHHATNACRRPET